MLRYTDLRLDASTVRELPDGSIKVTGQLTRPGIFEYRNPDGSLRREWRPADEVFRRSALETFAGVTVTVGHPRTSNGASLVTADTWRSVAIGNIGDNVREDGGHVVADIYIRDAAAVAKVKRGELRHISCGYNVDYAATPGTTPDGQRYDGVQRNIRGNHVALLPVGVAPRGGNTCVLRLDSAGNESTEKEQAPMSSYSEMYGRHAREAHARWQGPGDAARADVEEAALPMADGPRFDVANCPTYASLYERSVRASQNRWKTAQGDALTSAPAYNGGRP